ncbi:MAG TPA: KH domain-containing protein [Thermomicrobiales bacterium]|nr:KH domain-containing protein [Thermomicrobiales bacterium]
MDDEDRDDAMDDAAADEPFADEDEPPEDAADAAADESPAERLSGLVAYLAGNLIDDPESVEVDVQQRGSSVHLTLRVPDDELGKVIGRQGRIARALRTALSIAGTRSDVRATLDIEG